MDALPATERLASELRKLREHAGNPSLGVIQHWGRQQVPAVNLSKSKLSSWFNGRSVPAEDRAFTVLIDLLQAHSRVPRALRAHDPWQVLRDQAARERRHAIPSKALTSPQSDTGGAPHSSSTKMHPCGLTVDLKAAWSLPDGTQALLGIEAVGQTVPTVFSAPYFLAVHITNPNPVPIQIAGVGVEIACDAGPFPVYMFPPRGPLGRTQLPFDVGSYAGGWAVANAPELHHTLQAITRSGVIAHQVRAYALVGAGARLHSSWIPVTELQPLLDLVAAA